MGCSFRIHDGIVAEIVGKHGKLHVFLGLGDRIRPRRISIGFVSLKTYSNLCFNWENNSKRWDLRNFLRQPHLQGVASLLLAQKHCFD